MKVKLSYGVCTHRQKHADLCDVISLRIMCLVFLLSLSHWWLIAVQLSRSDMFSFKSLVNKDLLSEMLHCYYDLKFTDCCDQLVKKKKTTTTLSVPCPSSHPCSSGPDRGRLSTLFFLHLGGPADGHAPRPRHAEEAPGEDQEAPC